MGACAAGRREGERSAQSGGGHGSTSSSFCVIFGMCFYAITTQHATHSLYKHSLHSRQTTPYTHYAPQDKDHAGERGVVPTLRHEYERTQDP